LSNNGQLMQQTTRFDLLLQPKAMIQVGAMITLRNGAQGLDPPRSLLSWGP